MIETDDMNFLPPPGHSLIPGGDKQSILT